MPSSHKLMMLVALVAMTAGAAGGAATGAAVTYSFHAQARNQISAAKFEKTSTARVAAMHDTSARYDMAALDASWMRWSPVTGDGN
jgi:hypothetical protein